MRLAFVFPLIAVSLYAWGVASAAADEWNVSGQVRGGWTEQASNASSPANLAGRLLPGLIAAPINSAVAETEWHLSGKGVSAIATVQGQLGAASHTLASAWFNELYGTVGEGAWQLSAGKKIVAWDVGYGFRPNDVVQQEKRRSVICTTAIGRPLATLDYFDANLAATVVWVNPDRAFSKAATLGNDAQEQALATRIYYRAGSADLHGFARYGAKTGASVGAALAWVATDALELHASARFIRRSQGRQSELDLQNLSAVQRSSPWLLRTQENLAQVLLGGTWITEEQHSFLLEAWRDDTAISYYQWRDWSQRNAALAASAASWPKYQHELADNLAWQTQVLTNGSNLQRENVFARWSWQRGAWQPALDILWTPQDGGRVLTASIGWQGDRWHVDGALRWYGGPSTAVLSQLPSSAMAYVSATWTF